MNTIKVYISQEDAEDMISDFNKHKEHLWNVWTFPVEETGESIDIMIYVGNEEDVKDKGI